MQMSATRLGKEYGLTAEDMNRVLVKLGILEGDPGSYFPTEEGLKYAVEKDFHRGNGGYAHYNRYWTTRTFDDSIKDKLNVTDEIKAEVKAELAALRAARSAALKRDHVEADAAFIAKQAALEAMDKVNAEEVFDGKTLRKIGLAGCVFVAATGAGYGIYKAGCKVKLWWKGRKQADGKESESDNED